MKKLLVFVLAAILALSAVPACLAEAAGGFDSYLEAATAADLLALRDEVDLAIRQTDVWEEVEVPVGTYQVGVDIPEGLWTVSAGMDSTYCWMMAGDALEDNGREIDFLGSDAWHDFTLASPYSYDDVEYLQRSEESVYLPDGYYVEVSNGSILFTPYHGKPNFQFFAAEMPSETGGTVFSLEGLSYDELIGIKDKLNLALWNSYDWERVLVPFGIYKVGTDFPEGHWSLEPPAGSSACVEYGPGLMGSQMGLSISGSWAEYLYSEDYPYYDEGDVSKTDINMSEGNYFSVSSGVYAWVTPYVSGASLGFKAFGGGADAGTPAVEETLQAEGTVGTYNGIEYEQLDYGENVLGPDLYSGKKIMFSGEVIQAVEGSLFTLYRVRLDTGDVVLVRHISITGNTRALEGDHVTVYGTSQGVETYQSTQRKDITIPSCLADAIVLDD